MIKKTLYFENPAYLSLKDKQLVIKLPEVEKNPALPDTFKADSIKTIPVEDIGVVLLDNKQITITHGLMEALLANNCALITCDSKRMPFGMHLPLSGNTLQSERFTAQIEASLSLKKQLWQQTIQAKIINQSCVLHQTRNIPVKNMQKWASEVKSGDSDNLEGRAAVFYWGNLFPDIEGFKRGREEAPPNNLLNYGYAILRAIVARSLVASGLLPVLGIHHHNRYNAYCLADDIMEPYRPFVDKLVVEIVDGGVDFRELTKEIKVKLLNIPIIDVVMNGQRSPLMIASGHTAASLAKCYLGESRKIAYPSFT
ncbi:MAG: type II CRISPR-associated endonuclease Cas1 [Dysgonamonadaceae bacterium]|jgi:CRISPR-associated protein Cas1|nr:type II CRISPR-associated endonuclease Cas1 [Dysgonamonadaceae bacterium]